ncbi:hypothetical protein U0070_027263 [Myodes glareolus]|uniref:Uncharacterized protein n=1 Tax=Myodes glareolus TaxID=447135 RepID=A0AAW0HJ34_MYOGA
MAIKWEGFWLTVQDYTKMGKVKTGDLNNWSHCISRQEEESKEDSAHFLLFIQCSIPAQGMVPHKSINLSTIIPQSMSIGQGPRAADIHQVGRKVSLGHRAATQRGSPGSPVQPYPHKQQHREEEERRHRRQGYDQVQCECVLILGRIARHLWQRKVGLREAIHQQHMQSDTGRPWRIAIVLDQQQQPVLGRIALTQQPGGSHFAIVSPHAEQSGLRGLQQLERQPGILARVTIHRHHFGDQVAWLCRPGQQLCEGRRGVLQRVEYEGRIVVGVHHQHAHQRLATERGRSFVCGAHVELKGLQGLVVQRPEREQLSVFGIDRNERGEGQLWVVGGQQRVESGSETLKTATTASGTFSGIELVSEDMNSVQHQLWVFPAISSTVSNDMEVEVGADCVVLNSIAAYYSIVQMNHIFFIHSSVEGHIIYMMDYIDRFAYVEPTLHLWDEAYLIIMDNFSNVFLDSVCQCFIENYRTEVHESLEEFLPWRLPISSFKCSLMDLLVPVAKRFFGFLFDFDAAQLSYDPLRILKQQIRDHGFEELELTSPRVSPQTHFILIALGQGPITTDIHQVTRKVSFRQRAATHGGRPGPPAQPHPHEQQHRQEKERRHRCQGNDQVQRECIFFLCGVLRHLWQRQVGLREAIHQQHMQSDTGRALRIAIVLDQQQQPVLGHIALTQQPGRAHLTIVSPNAEQTRLCSLEQLKRQPGILARVAIHCHHLGDQFCEGRRGILQRVKHEGRIVVGVQYLHAHQHLTAERGRALVCGAHEELEGLQGLIVQRPEREQLPIVGIDGDERGEGQLRVLGWQQRVEASLQSRDPAAIAACNHQTPPVQTGLSGPQISDPGLPDTERELGVLKHTIGNKGVAEFEICGPRVSSQTYLILIILGQGPHAADINQVSRKVSFRHRAATQRGLPGPPAQPHPHKQQHRQEKERRHRSQGNDQIECEEIIIILRGVARHLRQRKVGLREAINHQHMQSNTGRSWRIAIVLDQQQQPVLGRIALTQQPGGAHLTIVAWLCCSGQQLCVGHRGVLQRVEHEGRIVVGVQHQHAHQRLAAERGRALVCGAHVEIEGLQSLIIQRPEREQLSIVRIDGDERGEGQLRVVGGQQRVESGSETRKTATTTSGAFSGMELVSDDMEQIPGLCIQLQELFVPTVMDLHPSSGQFPHSESQIFCQISHQLWDKVPVPLTSTRCPGKCPPGAEQLPREAALALLHSLTPTNRRTDKRKSEDTDAKAMTRYSVSKSSSSCAGSRATSGLREAIHQQHLQTDTGRALRIAIVLDHQQQPVLGRIALTQQPGGAHLTIVSPHAEQSGLRGLQQLERQPGVLARVAIHCHHLGDQVAWLCRPGQQFCEGRRRILQGVEHEGRIVVGVQHVDAHQRLAAEVGRALVCGAHVELEGLQGLIVQRPESEQLTIFGIYGNQRGDGQRVVGGQQRVGDVGIGA